MKQDITDNQFIDAFKACGRGNQFSYEALNALYNWLEDELDGEYVLDVIALCCEWAEYETIQAFNDDYGKDCNDMEDISDYTIYINIDDERFLIAQF